MEARRAGVGVGKVADGRQAVEKLKEKFSDDIVRSGCFRDQHWVEVKQERLVDICLWLRDEPDTSFSLLLDVTAVHWPDDPLPMEMIYHLYSKERKERLRVKVRTADRGPVPSLNGVWLSAAWNERETYDMFGIEFEGHPDLRRILMPDDYTDFPLRKEFPLFRG
jgi:NADH-quinone oxidoreductase subunit C